MTLSTTKRRNARQLDTLLALPLDRFRRAIGRLTDEELTALAERLELQVVKNRWERGGQGIARHRAVLELSLLARRQEELRRETDARQQAATGPAGTSEPPEATPERAA